MNSQLPPLTGPLKEKSQKLKIKDNAVHAGHSVLPVLLNHGLFSAENHGIFLNNNSLTVQPVTEITDATVDGHQALLNTSRNTVWLLNNNIHMLPKLTIVLNKEVISTSVTFLLLLDVKVWPQVSPQNHSQSLLMPPTGLNINLESSTTVLPALTTPYFWSELMPQVPGKLRTLGELDGENQDISD